MGQYDKTIQKMINFDDVTKGNKKYHNPNWNQIPDHSYRILLIGDAEFGRTNSLFNLISHQPGIDKSFLYENDPRKISIIT